MITPVPSSPDRSGQMTASLAVFAPTTLAATGSHVLPGRTTTPGLGAFSAFLRSQGFHPPVTCRSCFVPATSMGFALQGCIPFAQPYTLSSAATLVWLAVPPLQGLVPGKRPFRPAVEPSRKQHPSWAFTSLGVFPSSPAILADRSSLELFCRSFEVPAAALQSFPGEGAG